MARRPDITIRLMQPADLNTLQFICRAAYSENFGHHWTDGGLTAYLEKVFAADRMAKELADPNIQYYVAFRETGPAADPPQSRPPNQPINRAAHPAAQPAPNRSPL